MANSDLQVSRGLGGENYFSYSLGALVQPKNKEGGRAVAENVCLEHTKRQVKVFFLPFIFPYVYHRSLLFVSF